MKRLLVLLFSVIIGFTLIAKVERADWDKLALHEKKAIINVATDLFFQRTSCGVAEFRILIQPKEIEIYAQCVERRQET